METFEIMKFNFNTIIMFFSVQSSLRKFPLLKGSKRSSRHFSNFKHIISVIVLFWVMTIFHDMECTIKNNFNKSKIRRYSFFSSRVLAKKLEIQKKIYIKIRKKKNTTRIFVIFFIFNFTLIKS